MKKTRTNNINKMLVGGAMALSVFSTSFLAGHITNVSAAYDVLSTISNNYFSQSSGSDALTTPSNWELLNPTNSNNIKSGVIDSLNINNEDLTEYGLSNSDISNLPFSSSVESSNKNLMISSSVEGTRAGYESSDFTLDSNSYYKINVTLQTTANAEAAIKVVGLSDTVSTEQAQITTIKTNKNWSEYTIYIQTSQFKSESVTLQLWLDGGIGAAFFNHVTLHELAEGTFKNEVNTLNSTEKLVTPTNNYAVEVPNFIENQGFEAGSTLTNWTLADSSQTENETAYIETNAAINDGLGASESPLNNILVLENAAEGKQTYTSTEFTIAKNETYVVSVWAKSATTAGNATIDLTQTLTTEQEENDVTPLSASVTVSNSIVSNKLTNDWTEYKIYVKGHPLNDTTATLNLSLGTDTSATGYAYFDDIKLQQISYEAFELGSSESNSTTYSFNTANTGYTVVNGNFNETEKPEATLTYPLGASSWTQSTPNTNVDLSTTLSGIVNTNDSSFAGYPANNPGLTPYQTTTGATTANSSNNVLAINNPNQIDQTYTSEAFTLTSKTYYSLSVQVNTQYLNTQTADGAQISLFSTNHIALQTSSINTNSTWQTVNFYFYTGSTTEYQVALSLLNAQGYVFFDNVEIRTIDETAYNDATLSTYDKKIKLNTDELDSFDLYTPSENDLKTPYEWTSETEESSAVFGIINTSDNNDNLFMNVPSLNTSESNNLLAIKATSDTNLQVKSSNSISLNSGTYYEISVNVRTYQLTQEARNNVYDDEGNLNSFGINIGLTGYTESFANINTQDLNNNNFVTYTFYISPSETTTTNLVFNFGTEESLISGYAFFDDVKVSTIDEAVFITKTENLNHTALKLGNPVSTPEEETSGEFEGTPFDLFLIPSLLMALAILIAVFGILFRNFKFTKKPKIKTDYDRRNTLEVDLDKRERIELRNQIIDELNLEFKSIQSEIDALVKEFEQAKLQVKKAHEQKLAEYNEVKKAIIVEREQATRDYNNKLTSTENLTEDQKAKFEKQFKSTVSKLDKKLADNSKNLENKNTAIEAIELKHNAMVKDLKDKQKYIKEEITKIELEIKQISAQEDIMWNEYRLAKEKAKKDKLAHLETKRKSKKQDEIVVEAEEVEPKATKTKAKVEPETEEVSTDSTPEIDS